MKEETCLLISMQRGTVVAEDTGELVALGSKSRKKDSDTTSKGRSAVSRIHHTTPTDVLQHLVSTVFEHLNTISYASSLSCASNSAG